MERRWAGCLDGGSADGGVTEGGDGWGIQEWGCRGAIRNSWLSFWLLVKLGGEMASPNKQFYGLGGAVELQCTYEIPKSYTYCISLHLLVLLVL